MKLGDICQIRYGKDHKGLIDGSIPAYGSGGVMRYVDRALWDKPSVLIPRKGTLENLFFVDQPFWTVDTLFWTEIDESKVLPKFLYYTLRTKNLAELNVGTAVPSLTTKVLNEVEVEVPSLDVQARTVALLSSFDDAAALNNRTNDYLAAICDAAFSEQFGNTDDNAVLSDIADITMGQSPSGKSYNEEGKGAVFYQGRGEFGWRFPTQRLFTTEPKRMAAAGDVLMSVRAPVGDLNVAYEDCCIGRGLAAIHSQYPSFCLDLLRSLSRRLNAYNSEGTVFGSINGKTLKALKIALPDKKSIESFEAKADSIDVQIKINEVESRNLIMLRDALLPKLMTGEIDPLGGCLA